MKVCQFGAHTVVGLKKKKICFFDMKNDDDDDF